MVAGAELDDSDAGCFAADGADDGGDDDAALGGSPGVDAVLDVGAALDGGSVAPVAVATSNSSRLTDDGVPGGIGSIEERNSASSMRASVTCSVSRELV